MSEGGKRSGMRFLARGKEEGKGKKWMVTTAEEEKEGGNTGRERGWVLITIVSRRRPADEFCGGVNALVEIEVHTHTHTHTHIHISLSFSSTGAFCFVAATDLGPTF